MERRNLFSYLLLNIFVSAAVTGGMLLWYDRTYRANLPAVGGAAASAPASTLSPQTDIPVKISSVVGAGSLESEIVVVKFEGASQLELAGWQLKDENGNVFTFPKLTLYPNGAVQIHTASGADTVIDLYWGLGEAVWNSGETARLFDPQGNLRALYRVP